MPLHITIRPDICVLQRSKKIQVFSRDFAVRACFDAAAASDDNAGITGGNSVIQRAMRDSDVIAGGVLAALGVYIILQANRWEYVGFDGPGPGFFPLWYGMAITILSLWLVLARVLRLRREGTGGVDWSGAGRALGTWALFAISVAAMPWLGFPVSFGLLTLLLVRIQFRQSWRTALFTAVGLSVGFYVLFPLLLDVPLPAGRLGF